MMTGQYIHGFGHRTLWQLLRPHEPSLMRYLKQAGYRINFYGKNDLYSQEYLNEICDNIDELRGGFKTRTPVSGYAGKNPYALTDPRFFSFLFDPVEETSDTVLLPRMEQKALEFLEDTETDGSPFMLYIPSVMPHPPYSAPKRYYDMYDQTDVSELITPFSSVSGDVTKIREYREHFKMDTYGDDYPERIYKIYLGMVSYIDFIVGKFIETLERKNLIKNTVIIITSDHGDYAGNKGLFEKRGNSMDDDMLHIPLIIKTPSCVKNKRVNGQVELFDIMPTIMDLSGVGCGHEHHAVSLMPHMTGDFDDLNRPVFAEGGYNPREHEQTLLNNAGDGIGKTSIYYKHLEFSSRHQDTNARTVCIRTPEYKLIWRAGDANELYDLSADKRETINQINNPKYIKIKQELMERLLQWYITTSDVPQPGQDSRLFK